MNDWEDRHVDSKEGRQEEFRDAPQKGDTSQSKQVSEVFGPEIQARPLYATPYASPKDHMAAGLFALFLGVFGIHKFYLGYNAQGFIMFTISVVGGILTVGIAVGVMLVVSIIEAILYFSKSQSEFERIYVYGKREWF